MTKSKQLLNFFSTSFHARLHELVQITALFFSLLNIYLNYHLIRTLAKRRLFLVEIQYHFRFLSFRKSRKSGESASFGVHNRADRIQLW